MLSCLFITLIADIAMHIEETRGETRGKVISLIGWLWLSMTRFCIWWVGIIQLPSKWECARILVTEQTLSLCILYIPLTQTAIFGSLCIFPSVVNWTSFWTKFFCPQKSRNTRSCLPLLLPIICAAIVALVISPSKLTVLRVRVLSKLYSKYFVPSIPELLLE